MENQNRWILGNDVVLKANPLPFKDLKTCTVEELIERLIHHLGQQPLLAEGLSCRVLAPGNPWKQGKVRLVVEFCEDESLA